MACCRTTLSGGRAHETPMIEVCIGFSMSFFFFFFLIILYITPTLENSQTWRLEPHAFGASYTLEFLHGVDTEHNQ
jgi:hypothetical protein